MAPSLSSARAVAASTAQSATSSPSSSTSPSTSSITSNLKLSLASQSNDRHTQQFWDRREFACGYGAALINICTTFPINKVMFRQMFYGVRATRAVKQLQSEGLSNLYKGLLPPLMSKTVSVSIMFGSYSSYRSWLDLHHNGIKMLSEPMTRLSIAAILSGSTEAILCPFERMQMLLQSREFGERFSNTFKTFRLLLTFGLKEYYRGLTAILMRNGPSNIIFFAAKEKFRNFQSLHPPNSHAIVLFQHFLTGSALGAAISTIFYPINVVRTKMQTVSPGSPYMSMYHATKLVYRERKGSIVKIYYGCGVNATRALLSWGIINVSYEILRSILYEPSELEELRKQSKGVFVNFVPSSSSNTNNGSSTSITGTSSPPSSASSSSVHTS